MDIVKVTWCDNEVEAQRIGFFLTHACCRTDKFLVRHEGSGLGALICGLPRDLAIAAADTYSTYGVATEAGINRSDARNRRIYEWVGSCLDNLADGDDYPSFRDWHTSVHGERPQILGGSYEIPRTKLDDTGFDNPLDLVELIPNRHRLN